MKSQVLAITARGTEEEEGEEEAVEAEAVQFQANPSRCYLPCTCSSAPYSPGAGQAQECWPIVQSMAIIGNGR